MMTTQPPATYEAVVCETCGDAEGDAATCDVCGDTGCRCLVSRFDGCRYAPEGDYCPEHAPQHAGCPDCDPDYYRDQRMGR